MGTFRLFVYGTLMRGGSRHAALGDARLVGPARTAPRYALYDLGSYPGLVPGDGVVHGELYDVDESRVSYLDAVEGTPDLFRREEVELEEGRAWAYLFAPPVGRRPRLEEGRWRNGPPALG